MFWLCLSLIIAAVSSLITGDEGSGNTTKESGYTKETSMNRNRTDEDNNLTSNETDHTESKSVYPDNALRAFRSYEERLANPAKSEFEYLCQHPGGYRSSDVNVMTTSQYLFIHPEHADRVPGSYFDRISNPQNYI